ncbi:MAG: epimerase [Planctomycetes bacterium]|nr:epimerase [Planctomycetota bacterium]
MRVFVTGATGFLGGSLARQLLDQGDEVVALVRSSSKGAALAEYASKAPGRIDFTEGDITDIESMRPGMQGADGVYHLAAWYKVGATAHEAKLAERINVDGTRNVLDLMGELQIPKGVYTSTLAVNSDTEGVMVDESYHFEGAHLSAYDATKAEAHGLALQAMQDGLPLVVAMPGLIYGPDDHSSIGRMIRNYLRRKLPLIPAKPEYCWAYVDDVATAHRLGMQHGRAGEKYIVCGERCSLVEAFSLMEEICGVPAPSRTAGPGLLRFLAGFMQAFQWMKLPPDYHPETLRVAARATYLGDNSKAKRELGYEPRDLLEGLPLTLRHEMEKLGLQFPG